MKHWRIALAGLLGLLFIGFALVWFMPACWVVPLIAGRLNGVQLEEVSGLLWRGHAGRVLSAKGEDLGQLDWQLSRSALLGSPQWLVDLRGPRVQFHGRMQGRSATEALWTDVHMKADLELLGTRLTLPAGRPRGTVKVVAPSVQLQGGWPLAVDAHFEWQDASLLTPRSGELALGALQLAMHGSNGVIEGHLYDSGKGPLHIDGRLQLSPLAWRFNAVAAPRQPTPALVRWLAAFGPTSADGVTHIQYSGGLVAAVSGGNHE
ncbi:type II secretion system protein N [Dyella amyloliquefaciens]|uniref:type II secretion system protein N n=1 Tax=Dyella amyloliquefaciens TaxID=1770545 RepID=UPI00102E5A5E|nr:type II secretion system protein N [Dyella amyloliquefaciens]